MCTSSQQKCVHNTQKMSYSPSFSMGASSKPLNLRLWLIHCVIIWAWLWDRQFQQENGASRIDIDQHSHQWTMHLLLQRSVNRKIFQNVYFRPHFHFLICLVFPGIPLVKNNKNEQNKYFIISKVCFAMKGCTGQKAGLFFCKHCFLNSTKYPTPSLAQTQSCINFSFWSQNQPLKGWKIIMGGKSI